MPNNTYLALLQNNRQLHLLHLLRRPDLHPPLPHRPPPLRDGHRPARRAQRHRHLKPRLRHRVPRGPHGRLPRAQDLPGGQDRLGKVFQQLPGQDPADAQGGHDAEEDQAAGYADRGDGHGQRGGQQRVRGRVRDGLEFGGGVGNCFKE